MSFGMMEALLSFIRRQVGLRTDDASSTGSLHAKIGDARNLINTVNANVNRAPWASSKTPVWLYGKYTTSITPNNSIDVLTLSGPRIILGGFLIMQQTYIGVITIIIDGVSHQVGASSDSTPHGDCQFLDNLDDMYGGTASNIFQRSYFKGMADYRFFTQRQSSYDTYIAGAGIFTLPMMYINSSLIVRARTYESYSMSPNLIYNIFHTSV